MERFLGLDVGDRRIGVAVSDSLGMTAQPVETYERVGYGPDVRHFQELAARYEVTSVVCGLPRNMDGTQGGQVKKVRDFAEQLQKAGLEVFFEDERLTTVMAERALLEADMRRDGRKKKVDMVAATLILQSWLDRLQAQAEGAADGEEDDGLLELEDDEGNPVTFRRVAELRHGGSTYLFLTELEDDADSFFLEEVMDAEGNPQYRTVEDEALITTLYDLYLQDEA